ncbi:MAG: hypothetical protein JRK53_10140 [Deltaproteobacteria bacterium]|nr:hypothetical protein [Deltaproteobacteria bacterium]MBW1818232.1 hypothetical protein [Deltaproteobacteria bacterium]
MKQSYVHFGMGHAQKLSTELKAVNNEMKGLLDRLPLKEHMEIAELSKLAKTQTRLMEKAARPGTEKERAFLDRERYSAMYLRQRYSRALFTGGVRRLIRI